MKCVLCYLTTLHPEICRQPHRIFPSVLQPKRRSDVHSSGGQSSSNAMFQTFLARQHLEEEEERRSDGGVPVPSDMSTSSALMQAMLARQRAEDLVEDVYQMSDKHLPSSGALTQAMQARQRAEGQEGDEFYSTAGFSENPVNRSDAVMQARQARQRAEDDRIDDTGDPTSSVSNVMMQVMQARQRAEEENRSQRLPARPQNPVPSGSSALIQAMLARQQAGNGFDDGY